MTCFLQLHHLHHLNLVFFVCFQIEVTARVRWTGPKPTTPPFTSPTSSPYSSSAFSSPWWSCSSPTSPSSRRWRTQTPCQRTAFSPHARGRWRETSPGWVQVWNHHTHPSCCPPFLIISCRLWHHVDKSALLQWWQEQTATYESSARRNLTDAKEIRMDGTIKAV